MLENTKGAIKKGQSIETVIAPLVFSNVYLSCVLCTLCCQFLWIVLFWLPLWYSLTFIYVTIEVSNTSFVLVFRNFPTRIQDLSTITPQLTSNVLHWQFPQYNNESEMYIQLNVGFDSISRKKPFSEILC
jgi:hypothetical protein